MASNYFAQLPAYRNSGELDFAPLNQAVQNFGETTRQNAMADYQAGRNKVADGRAAAAEGRAARKFTQEQSADALNQMAGIYQAIEAAPEAERPMMLQRAKPMFDRLRKMDPDWDADAQAAGVAPDDYAGIGKLVIGRARGPVDPLDAQVKRAQIQNLTAKNALDESIARMLSGADESHAPTQAPASAPPAGIRPQSYQGGPANPSGFQPAASTNAFAQPPQTGLQLAADETAPEAEEHTTGRGPNPGAVYNLPGDEVVNTPMGKMTRDRARRLGMGLAAAGKGEAGKMMIDAASGGDQRMGKAANTTNDKEELAATKQMAVLDTIKSEFNAKYLTIPNRITQWGRGAAEKLGATLSPADKSDLQGYARFRQSAWRNMNQVLKDLAGTAVTESEMKRQLLDLPDPGQGIFDGDAPTVFASKLDGAVGFAKSAIARSRYLRSQGFTGKPWEAGIAVEDMPAIINQRGQQIEQQLRQQNPNINPQSLEMQVDKTLKQEFGI